MQEPETIVRGIYEAETIAGSGLRQEGYLVWGGSVIEENGLYHLFVSRWPTALGHNAWTTSSEVAHAVSTNPLGPWTVRDVALPRRGKQWWDGMATHNPTVHWHPRRREYVLYYIGMTFDFAPPKDAPLLNRSQYETAWNAKRVGVATSTSLDGPWRRSSHPVLEPRVGHWDGGITSNPAVTFPTKRHGPSILQEHRGRLPAAELPLAEAGLPHRRRRKQRVGSLRKLQEGRRRADLQSQWDGPGGGGSVSMAR